MSPRLRCFGENAETALQKAMSGAPESIQRCKLQLIQLLVYCLKRFTAINHLSSSARKVFESKEQMTIMSKDYSKFINEVPLEPFWVTDSNNTLVQSVHNEFKERLCHVSTLEDWTQWVEGILSKILDKYAEKSFEEQLKASKQFLLKWNYFTDSIQGVLTMKAADSFGMFHLLRVLYKDYLFYSVQKRLAAISDQPLICMFLDYFPPPQQNAVKFERQTSNPGNFELGQHSQQSMHSSNDTPTYLIVEQSKYPEMGRVGRRL